MPTSPTKTVCQSIYTYIYIFNYDLKKSLLHDDHLGTSTSKLRTLGGAGRHRKAATRSAASRFRATGSATGPSPAIPGSAGTGGIRGETGIRAEEAEGSFKEPRCSCKTSESSQQKREKVKNM